MEITLELPDQYFVAATPQEVIDEVKRNHALISFQQGHISIGAACKITNMNIYDFLELCHQHEIDTIHYEDGELQEEVRLASEELS